MTDKEQIMINGVDVSKCEYVCNTAFGNIGCKLPFNEEIHCCNIPNCYYKQLARKEQDINDIHEYYKDLRSNATELADKYVQLRRQLEEKEQAGEALKSKIHDLRQLRELDREARVRFYNKVCEHRKALEAIEKHIKVYEFSEGEPFILVASKTLRDILDIINKAKEEENEE